MGLFSKKTKIKNIEDLRVYFTPIYGKVNTFNSSNKPKSESEAIARIKLIFEIVLNFKDSFEFNLKDKDVKEFHNNLENFIRRTNAYFSDDIDLERSFKAFLSQFKEIFRLIFNKKYVVVQRSHSLKEK